MCCVWLRLHSRKARQGKARLRTAGEAEAAEPSTHNGAPREGEGRRLQRGWEPGSRNGGSEGGTKERQEKGRAQIVAEDGGENEDVNGECCGDIREMRVSPKA